MSEKITTITDMPKKGYKFNIKVDGEDKGAYTFDALIPDKSELHFSKSTDNKSTTSPAGIDVPFEKNSNDEDVIKSGYEITKIVTGGKRKSKKSKKSNKSKKSKKSRKSRR